MISDYKEICKSVSIDNSIDINLLLSINNIVFKEVFDWTKNPKTLKIYLKYFGSWYFKKRKTRDKLDIYIQTLNSNTSLLDANRGRVENKIKNYEFILSEYDKYTRDKYEIKCQKYGKEAYEAYCMAKKQKKI